MTSNRFHVELYTATDNKWYADLIQNRDSDAALRAQLKAYSFEELVNLTATALKARFGLSIQPKTTLADMELLESCVKCNKSLRGALTAFQSVKNCSDADLLNFWLDYAEKFQRGEKFELCPKPESFVETLA